MLKATIALLLSSSSTVAMTDECKFNKESANQSFATIARMLENKEIKEINIRYFSVGFYTRVPLPMRELEAKIDPPSSNPVISLKEYNIKLPSDKDDNLASAIRRTVMREPDKVPPDLRRRINFVDQHGRLISSIYFGTKNTPSIKAYINDICVDLSPEVYDWISGIVNNTE